MIDINALVAGQMAVNAVQQEMKARILRDVPDVGAENPSVYFKLTGGDYDVEVRTSRMLSERTQDQIGNAVESVQKEFGIYPALKGGLTIYYTID